jgi:hypothetical protein
MITMYKYSIERLLEEISEIKECILLTKEYIIDPKFSFKSIEENEKHLEKLELELTEKVKELKKLIGE